ncbi:DUF4062 domain-containing protein [Runella sp.]|uniref:nSTAND1 domain-containing NTPase n=1 Tax=Runella sp. TaxID=1960881 RepID=UPI003D0BE565
MAKWKVYLSSTFRDLKEVRAELIQLFQKQLSNQFELTEIMEWMYDKGTYARFEIDCIKAVNDSDIYIIILGNKVGSFPDPETRTYTEIELDTALQTPGKMIFCLRLETFDEQEIDHKAKHRELLNKFAGRPVHTFKDTESLKNRMYECLYPFASQSPINISNPYKGLAAFEVKDGGYFYGRGAEIESFIKEITVRQQRYISVIGNSGIGKTSFIQAGVLYKLQNEPVWGFSHYQRIIITPGSTPFTNFQYQLWEKEISLEQLADENTPSDNFILFFNQFEEIITQCTTPEAIGEREQLFDFLSKLTSSPKSAQKFLIITTFRSDFLSQLANFDFIKKQRFFPLSSLDYALNVADWEKSIAEIITKPAEKNGVTIEPELVAQLTQELKEVDGSLPILQFMLEKIWHEDTIRDGKITSTEYIDLTKGKGIGGIIEAHADEVIKRIINTGTERKNEAILKSIFVNLVEVNANLRDVKKTIRQSELFKSLEVYPEERVKAIFEDLVSSQSRLLTVTESKDFDTAIEETEYNVDIIHEVLLRKWERLQKWIDERREALSYRKGLLLQIEEYKKNKTELYKGSKLDNALNWENNNPDLVNKIIKDFIEKSKKKRKSQLRKSFFFLGVLVAFLVFAMPAYNYWQKIQLEKLINNSDMLRSKMSGWGLSYNNIDIDKVSNLEINRDIYPFVTEKLHYFKNVTSLTLKGIPIEDLKLISNFSSLRYLSINDCSNLKSLDGIEVFKYLSELIIEKTAIKKLKGVETLEMINSIRIDNNDSLRNTDELRNLKSLSVLDIGGKGMSNLDLIRNLDSLKSLTINTGDIEDLNGVESLKSLTNLVIKSRNVKNIKSLGNSKSITFLNLSNTGLIDLQGLGSSETLDSLVINENPSLLNLHGIENNKRISAIFLERNPGLKSLIGIKNLGSLKTLIINSNDSLENLDGLENVSLSLFRINNNNKLLNLKDVQNVSVDSLFVENNFFIKTLDGIDKLKSISFLSINNNTNLYTLKETQKLNRLNSLILENNKNLTDINAIEKIRTPFSLALKGDIGVHNMRQIANSKMIISLIIQGESINSLEGLENIKSLTSLAINYNNNGNLFKKIKTNESISSVIISGGQVPDLDKLKNLKNLSSLSISSSSLINPDERPNLKGIENLVSLNKLSIELSSLTNLEKIKNLKKLKSLVLKMNQNLVSLKGIESLVYLDSLTVTYNNSLYDFRGINNLIFLKYIDINGLKNLDEIIKLKSLSSLTMYRSSVENLNRLKNLKKITSFSISFAEKNDLVDIAGIKSIVFLSIDYSRLENLEGIENLKNLKELTLSNNDSLSSLLGLEKLTSLESLGIYRSYNLRNLSALENLFSLKELKIDMAYPSITNFLYSFRKLKKLTVPKNMPVDYERLQEKNPGIKLIRQ